MRHNALAESLTGDEASDAPVRVLLVDDDAQLSRSLEPLMRRVGLAPRSANNGATALEALDDEEFDVVLLDLRMANVDGFGVMTALQSKRSAPRVILHSGYLDVKTTVQAMRAGAAEVLEKPVEFKLLAERLKHFGREAQAQRAREHGDSEPPAAPQVGPLAQLLGTSDQMADVRYRVQCVAAFRDMSVLIEGPTGTGKELVARAIHNASAPHEPLVTVNCAAVPEHLFESELFGHEAGAFTSARGSRVGLLEEAGTGTVFLDEVGEMPTAIQPKLLQVLETREFRRVGSNKTRRLRARVVSATNRNLGSAPGSEFRSDLYFRLAGYRIRTPALRERLGDVEVLGSHFLKEFCDRYACAPKSLGADALQLLMSHNWPGNIRELRRVVENAAMLAPESVLDQTVLESVLHDRESSASFSSGSFTLDDPRASGEWEVQRDTRDGVRPSLPELERGLIVQAFQSCAGNLSRTARQLGIPRSTLRDRLKKYGIR